MFFGKFGEAEQKTDEEKQQESRDNLRNALVDIAQRKLEKERHLRSIDPTGRIFPLKQYLYLCRIADYIVQTQSFANFIFSCIAIAGLLVGIETYPALQDVYVLNIIETMVLVAFCAEVVLKVMAEGTDPSMYLRGKEWKWNIFDLTIVIMSMPFVTVVGNISFLRLIRLMRLAKVFNKIPQLRMIINGLLGGLKSIAYICILLFLVFYLFAISGILAFRKNDPWHFRSVITTLVGLFQFSTLSDWSEVFYINYYGCDKFEGSFYTNNVTLASTKSGGLTYCEAPEAQPFLSFLYFIAFIFICSFTMLSLFVGAIIESMTESMKTMKEEQEKEKRKKIMEEAQRKFKNVMANKNKQNKRVRRALNLLQLAFEGGNLKVVSENFEGEPFFKSSFKKLSHVCDKIADDSRFQNFVTFVIIVAGVQVGIATDPQIAREYRTVLSVVNQMIQFVFTIECAIKILAEEFAPWIYFDNGWNLFDFLVVAASYYSGGGSFIVMLRLVRLLRVLKLMRSLPQLQVIVSSLLSGLTSIGFISVLVLLFLYFYAIIGLIFFWKK